MNVRVLVSEDGGENFYTMSERRKHSDNHSLTFKANDPNYMLIGTDGGIYESFDENSYTSFDWGSIQYTEISITSYVEINWGYVEYDEFGSDTWSDLDWGYIE